jgi:hypothetical protein
MKLAMATDLSDDSVCRTIFVVLGSSFSLKCVFRKSIEEARVRNLQVSGSKASREAT